MKHRWLGPWRANFDSCTNAGPCAYVGRDMKTTHADLNITEVEWEALIEVFQASFDAFEIPEQEQTELFAIIAGTKADIVVAQ